MRFNRSCRMSFNCGLVTMGLIAIDADGSVDGTDLSIVLASWDGCS